MDPTLWMFIPGIVGGVVFAVLLRALSGRIASRPEHDAFADRGDVINFTSIRVAGVGGLGLLGLALAVAWTFPRIGQTLILGSVLGAGLAAVLIWRRRREGPLSTSSGRPGANTTLSIDQRQAMAAPDPRHEAGRSAKEIRLAAGSI